MKQVLHDAAHRGEVIDHKEIQIFARVQATLQAGEMGRAH
jgi:hypothetical protein